VRLVGEAQIGGQAAKVVLTLQQAIQGPDDGLAALATDRACEILYAKAEAT
jgi:hypothetical protein